MNYFWAFVVGGGICVIGQLLIDLTGLTPARILTGYVVAGVILRRRVVWAAGGVRRLRGYRAPAGVRASAGQGGADSHRGGGGYRHPHRGADGCGCGHHDEPCMRGGVLVGGEEP